MRQYAAFAQVLDASLTTYTAKTTSSRAKIVSEGVRVTDFLNVERRARMAHDPRLGKVVICGADGEYVACGKHAGGEGIRRIGKCGDIAVAHGAQSSAADVVDACIACKRELGPCPGDIVGATARARGVEVIGIARVEQRAATTERLDDQAEREGADGTSRGDIFQPNIADGAVVFDPTVGRRRAGGAQIPTDWKGRGRHPALACQICGIETPHRVGCIARHAGARQAILKAIYLWRRTNHSNRPGRECHIAKVHSQIGSGGICEIRDGCTAAPGYDSGSRSSHASGAHGGTAAGSQD